MPIASSAVVGLVSLPGDCGYHAVDEVVLGTSSNDEEPL